MSDEQMSKFPALVADIVFTKENLQDVTAFMLLILGQVFTKENLQVIT